jgi:hypothetical protein
MTAPGKCRVLHLDRFATAAPTKMERLFSAKTMAAQVEAIYESHLPRKS